MRNVSVFLTIVTQNYNRCFCLLLSQPIYLRPNIDKNHYYSKEILCVFKNLGRLKKIYRECFRGSVNYATRLTRVEIYTLRKPSDVGYLTDRQTNSHNRRQTGRQGRKKRR